MPYLLDMLNQTADKVLNDDTDIRKGKVLNEDILVYHHRSPEYPFMRYID
jgi:hypothetical protein